MQGGFHEERQEDTISVCEWVLPIKGWYLSMTMPL